MDHDVSRAELLVDVGSTVVKLCRRSASGELSPVRRVPREPGRLPGDQVRDLLRQAGPEVGALRVCSSANGGLRAAVLGLSGRHSVAAAIRAVTEAGGNVVYSGTFDAATGAPAEPVDVLVLVGGVDGADNRRLHAALQALSLAAHPHEVLVWAGADGADSVAGLAVDHRCANVLDRHLRPSLAGLMHTVRAVYVRDLVDRKGLAGVAQLTTAPIWPTPAVVTRGVKQMLEDRSQPVLPAPFVAVDVGGATTDVYVCVELRDAPEVRSAPEDSIIRQVFPDLGLVASASGLRLRLTADDDLLDLSDAVAADRGRELYRQLAAGSADVLEPPTGFLTCLYLALRRMVTGDGADRISLTGNTGLLLTGGAWQNVTAAQVRRVVDAVSGTTGPDRPVVFDTDYHVWARGLATVPATSADPALTEPC
jgi:hypothetical protein